MKKNRFDRGKPQVISGHTGFKEGPDTEHAAGEGGVTTLDSWVIAAVNDHSTQRKRDQTFHYFKEIFRGQVDDDVVHAVLAECEWQEEEAIEQLLELFPGTEEAAILPEERTENKFTLRAVAESWLKDTSSDSVPELAQTESFCSRSFSQRTPLSNDNRTLEKTLPCSVHHSAAYSDFAEVSESRNLSGNQCISKLRDQQLSASALSVHSKVILAHRSLFDNDPPNEAANSNSVLFQPPGSQENFSHEPSLDLMVDRNDIYFSDDEETYSDSTFNSTIQPAVNMNSGWSPCSNFVLPDSRAMPRNMPSYGFGLPDRISRAWPMTSQGLSGEQARYFSSPTSTPDNRHQDLSNKDFVMPHLPVQVRNSPTELRPVRLRSPVCSPQKLDAIQVMPQSIFTPRAMYNPLVGLTSPLPTFSARPGGKDNSITILSTEAAKRKVMGLLQQCRKVMILMRGCPGCGKTTLAREVQFNGDIFSADAFFERGGKYKYDPAKIGDAHAQTKQRALFAVRKGVNPVIIDNTNTQAWEMLPYVEMAVEYDYYVEVIEPDVSWRLKAKELAKHNIHGVPADKVASMLERYEHNVTAKKLLEAVYCKRQLLSQAPTVAHHAESLLPQPQELLTQPRQVEMPQQLQILKQPQRLLIQPQQMLMQPQQPLTQSQEPLQTQSTSRDDELKKKRLSKSARKRRQRQVKMHAAEDPEMSFAAAGCGSNEDENLKKEDASARSEAGSPKHDLIQHLDTQLVPLDFATLLTAPRLSSFESCKDELLPQTTKSISFGDLQLEKETQLQLNATEGADLNLCLFENCLEVLPETMALATCREIVSNDSASSEVDLSGNQVYFHSQTEQTPDLEIFEVEEIEVTSSGNISPPESFSDSIPRCLDDRVDVPNLSSTSDIDVLNCSSHFNALDRFAEDAQTSHTMHCTDSQFVKNPDECLKHPLHSATTSLVEELNYWSQKVAVDNLYSIQGVLKDNQSSTTCGPSWLEQDSGDSANVISYNCSSRCVNPKPQRNLKERKVAVEKIADAQVKISGNDGDASKTSTSKQHGEMFSLQSRNLATPVLVSQFAEVPRKASQESTSQTEALDLVAVYQLEKGEQFDASLFSNILTATPRAIIDRELAISSQMELDKKILAISKRNDSTMTDDLDNGNTDAKMAFLSSCFPTVTHDDLLYILNGCGNDMDMTANILLDSGYEYNKPNQQGPRSCEAPSTKSSTDGEALPVEQAPLKVQRKLGVKLSRTPVSYTICRDSVKPKVVPAVESIRGRRDKGQGTGRVQEKCNSLGPHELLSDDEKITMSLTPGFAAQLVDLFGPLHSSSPAGLMPDSGLSVNLSFELAKQIYDSWMVTQRETQNKNPGSMTKNTPSDFSQAQASAVWMADVCDFLSTTSVKGLSSPAEFTNRAQQMKFARDDSEVFPALSPSRPMKTPETKANSLSTKIKRQLLAERYRMINETILDEIYEATGFSYDITVKTIASCPELIAPPKVVMTKKKAEELELQLIERAIEESIRDQIREGVRKTVRNGDCDEVYEDILSEACMYFTRYQDNLQKAQDAHCKKLHPVAMHYSEEARLYKSRFREAQQMAAEMIMKDRLSDLSNRGSIDLHGFSVREALLLLQQSLSAREDELLERYDKRRAFLNVITGRGSHSHRKVARVKPAVEAYLTRSNYEFVESTQGVLKVRLHVGF